MHSGVALSCKNSTTAPGERTLTELKERAFATMTAFKKNLFISTEKRNTAEREGFILTLGDGQASVRWAVWGHPGVSCVATGSSFSFFMSFHLKWLKESLGLSLHFKGFSPSVAAFMALSLRQSSHIVVGACGRGCLPHEGRKQRERTDGARQDMAPKDTLWVTHFLS